MRVNENPEHKTAYSILEVVRGHDRLWHRLSLDGFRSVLRCGEIHCNEDGKYVSTYPQSNNSLARHLKSISLFDFDTNSTESLIEHEAKWVHFMMDQVPATIVLSIDRSRLNELDIILPWNIPYHEKLRKRPNGVEYYPALIPEVEILYKKPIPVSAIHEVLIVRHGGRFDYIRRNMDEGVLEFASTISNKWKSEEEDRRRTFLANNPNPTIADFIANPWLHDHKE